MCPGATTRGGVATDAHAHLLHMGAWWGGRAAERLLSIAFSLFLLANSNDIMTNN